jgi:integrase
MSTLFDLFQKTYGHEITPRVRRDYKRMFNTLDDYFGHMEVTAVKPKHVAAFINEPGYGKVHRNRHVMILNMVFLRAMGNWCIDFDLQNPCPPVRRHPTKPRTRYVTDEEFNAMRATCPPAVQIAMDLALLTGQRQGDIVDMKWAQVHFVEPYDLLDEQGQFVMKCYGTLDVDQGKSMGERKIALYISEALYTVLMRAKMMEPTFPHVHVIRTQRGYGYTHDGFRAIWQQYMRPWREAHPEVTSWRFHDIRAKCVSDTKDLQQASHRAGHADPRITSRVYDRNRRKVMPLR